MYMERHMLKSGDKLLLGKEYTIVKTIGTGASSIVYLAEEQIVTNGVNDLKRFVVIKELYPKNLGIMRKIQGNEDEKQNLLILDHVKDKFEACRAQLLNAVRIQNNFRNQEKLTNITMDMETVVECNNTVYVVMGRVVGESYNNVHPVSLKEVLTICRSIAYAVGKYHEIGYLHLDIKPANIYKIKETDEIIKLFDFDTVHKKEDIQNRKCIASFTLEYAAPELKELDYGCDNYEDIDERTDIFSIGVILFEKLFGRLPETEDLRPFKSWDFEKSNLTVNASPQLKSALTEILRKTLALLKRLRYASIEELLASLNRAIELAGEKIYLCDQNVTITTSKKHYIERLDTVKDIREKLEKEHIVYLHGVGGVGKSETAREYAEKYRDKYDVIQLVHYKDDLKKAIASLEFNGWEKDEERDPYKKVIKLLQNKELYNSNTLLIVDNYDVKPNSEEQKKNLEVLLALETLHIHVLFTTRVAVDKSERTKEISNLELSDLKKMFFSINPNNQFQKERVLCVEELIELAFYHTLTIQLVARQTVQVEEYGGRTLNDYVELLRKRGLNNGINKTIYNNKDNQEKNLILYEHIKILFDFSLLERKERYIMANASLLPIEGLENVRFGELIGLQDTMWTEDDTITILINGGWIERYGERSEKIRLHPLIREVAQNELKPMILNEECDKLYYNLKDKISRKFIDLPWGGWERFQSRRIVKDYIDIAVKMIEIKSNPSSEDANEYIKMILECLGSRQCMRHLEEQRHNYKTILGISDLLSDEIKYLFLKGYYGCAIYEEEFLECVHVGELLKVKWENEGSSDKKYKLVYIWSMLQQSYKRLGRKDKERLYKEKLLKFDVSHLVLVWDDLDDWIKQLFMLLIEKKYSWEEIERKLGKTRYQIKRSIQTILTDGRVGVTLNERRSIPQRRKERLGRFLEESDSNKGEKVEICISKPSEMDQEQKKMTKIHSRQAKLDMSEELTVLLNDMWWY